MSDNEDYEEGDGAGAGGAGAGGRKRPAMKFTCQKLKKLIQTDEAVGKISKNALQVVGRATELFIAGEVVNVVVLFLRTHTHVHRARGCAASRGRT
jgi:hypothetical protein